MRVLLRTPGEMTDIIGTGVTNFVGTDPIDLHRRLPGYAPTPLVEAPKLARTLGVGKVYVKNETSRFGLPSFKVLGASFAACATLAERLGPLPEGPLSHEALQNWASLLGSLTLLAATDGNHGRAVARVARWLGVEARIYVPNFVSPTRIRAIKDEGAEVIVVDGFYDASVDAALDASSEPGTVLISDTARTPTDPIPQLVTAGYTSTFAEVDEQVTEPIDVVAIQAGVGGLSTACTSWARSGQRQALAKVAVVEPETAACVMAALAADEPVGVAADVVSAMNVLQCGTISLTAFETLRTGVSCCLAVEDRFAERAAAELGAIGVATGPSGAAGLAGLLGALDGPMAPAVRAHLGLTPDANILVVATEAASAGAGPDVGLTETTTALEREFVLAE